MYFCDRKKKILVSCTVVQWKTLAVNWQELCCMDARRSILVSSVLDISWKRFERSQASSDSGNLAVHGEVWIEKNQQDATVRCLLLTSISTCFGHHYAHLQENKEPVTAFGVLLCFCWMWLVEQKPSYCSHPSRQRPTTATNHIQQNQTNKAYTPNTVTGPLFYWRWA